MFFIRFLSLISVLAATLGAVEPTAAELAAGKAYVAKERAAYIPANHPDGPSIKRLALPTVKWADMSNAKGYAAATASEPHYDNKALWPQLMGKEAYVAETWPKTRTLTWAKPGTNGAKAASDKDHAISVIEPANWLEDGKPASELWDEETDIVIPGHAQAYTVNVQDCGKRQEYRHITIGANALFQGGGDGVGRQIHGNVWVKHLGKIYAQGATTFAGGKNTFFRNDNNHATATCSQYFAFNRAGGTIEFLGHVNTADEFMVNEGTVIVGPDSIVQPGRCCAPYVAKGATLALMDNACFGNWANTWTQCDLAVRGGTVQAGFPDRPLTRSAALGLNFKNHMQAVKVKEGEQGIWFDANRVTSLLLLEGSTLRSFPAAGSKATLVVRESNYLTMCNEGGTARVFPWDGIYDFCREKWPLGYKNDMWFDSYPKGFDVVAFPQVTIDQVTFNGLRLGGMLVTDQATAATWQKVTYLPAGEKPTPVTTAKSNGGY